MPTNGAALLVAPSPVNRPTRRQLALVVWRADLGGAESVQAMLAREWRAAGVDAAVVVVTEEGPLGARLDDYGVPHVALGLPRGSHVLRTPRRVARAVEAVGRDGALVADPGYLSAVLRLGGYRGTIVGAEHGKLLGIAGLSRVRRAKDTVERAVGARFRSVDVGVSDFMLAELRRHPHARRVERIYNGIDLDLFSPSSEPRPANGTAVVGCAARFVAGKGIDDLVRAAAELRDLDLVVRIAGDGPERGRLEQLAAGEAKVEFVGRVAAMPDFWRSCDVAVVPSDAWVESFSMSTLEAMACGVPVVATDIGGVPEVLADGETGTIVPRGRPSDLATAIRRYVDDPVLRRRHGRAGAERARVCFSIAAAAERYLELFAA